jgi:hypothetical protein
MLGPDSGNTFNSSMSTAMGYSSSVLSGPSDILAVSKDFGDRGRLKGRSVRPALDLFAL